MKKVITLLLVGMLAWGIHLAKSQDIKVSTVAEFQKELKADILELQKVQPVALHQEQNWQRASQSRDVFKEPSGPIYATYLPTDYYSPVTILVTPVYTHRGSGSLGSYGNPINVNLSSFGSFGHSYLSTAVTDIYKVSRR